MYTPQRRRRGRRRGSRPAGPVFGGAGPILRRLSDESLSLSLYIYIHLYLSLSLSPSLSLVFGGAGPILRFVIIITMISVIFIVLNIIIIIIIIIINIIIIIISSSSIVTRLRQPDLASLLQAVGSNFKTVTINILRNRPEIVFSIQWP